MPEEFDNIPDAIKAWPQWVVWKLEERDGEKPTKVPYSPLFQGKASVTNPGTWGTFEQAVNAYIAADGALQGIGFVLTRDDPFGFIDLDNAWQTLADGSHKYPDPQSVFDRQMKIYETFETYAEWSPSGTGLHLIVNTENVDRGRKRGAIEAYTQERFMTMTGKVYRDLPITECTVYFKILWAELGGPASIYTHEGNEPQREDDTAIVEKALAALNGDKFRILHEGQWQQIYSSQSEADFAYVDIIAYYSKNRAQIERMFLASPLGQRDKAKRRNYREYMLNRAFDRQLPPIDLEGLKIQFENMIAANAKPAPMLNVNATGIAEGSAIPVTTFEPGEAQEASQLMPYEAEPVKPFPPGLVGEIAQFIYDQAPRPVHEMALVGAIGLMAGFVGRAYNVSGSGLNQYIMLIAPTGTGKEAINLGISKLMKQIVGNIENGLASAREFIGPAQIRSDAALLKWLTKSSSIVSVVGEVGIMLKMISQPNAPAHLTGLKAVLMDLYNKSGFGNVVNPMAYSDKEKNTAVIPNPAFTMVGESTPERFYEGLDEYMIADGLLPRFTILEYKGNRPAIVKGFSSVMPTFQLVDMCKQLIGHVMEINQKQTVMNVRFSPEAEALFDKFDIYADAVINQNLAGSNAHIYNRAHLKAMKLAALIAVGINPFDPVIDVETAEWACNLVVADAENITSRFERGEVGSGAFGQSEQQQMRDIIAIISSWVKPGSNEGMKYGVTPQMRDMLVIPYSSLQNRLVAMASFRNDRRGGTEAIKRILQTMMDQDDLRELPKAQFFAQYGKQARAFVVSNPSKFLKG